MLSHFNVQTVGKLGCSYFAAALKLESKEDIRNQLYRVITTLVRSLVWLQARCNRIMTNNTSSILLRSVSEARGLIVAWFALANDFEQMSLVRFKNKRSWKYSHSRLYSLKIELSMKKVRAKMQNNLKRAVARTHFIAVTPNLWKKKVIQVDPQLIRFLCDACIKWPATVFVYSLTYGSLLRF